MGNTENIINNVTVCFAAFEDAYDIWEDTYDSGLDLDEDMDFIRPDIDWIAKRLYETTSNGSAYENVDSLNEVIKLASLIKRISEIYLRLFVMKQEESEHE